MNSNWHELTAVGELPEIVLKSAERPQVLFDVKIESGLSVQYIYTLSVVFRCHTSTSKVVKLKV